MADASSFAYIAIDARGRRVKGVVPAISEPAAFDHLRREGLSPVSLKPHRTTAAAKPKRMSLGDRESAAFLASLADLLKARADIRTSLGILGERFEKPAAKQICQALNADISGGESLERAFARWFIGGQAFITSMVAAGEAAGDLPGGLQRAADVIQSRLKLRDQLVSVLAYPSFVLVSAVGALFVILLFIIPSIAPLATDAGAKPPPGLAAMIAVSEFLNGNLSLLGVGATGVLIVLLISLRLGLLTPILERLFLDGPARRTVGGIVFGGFSVSLGTMIAAGAPISDALRLAVRSVSSKSAQRRLSPIATVVRQGHALSDALSGVRGFPQSIIRLVAVGEASNAVGELLMRGGKLEEDAALRRIETLGRIAGPALIIILGAFLGLLMGGLLSGLSQVGEAVLG
jgi:type II secretory pathway component PulF